MLAMMETLSVRSAITYSLPEIWLPGKRSMSTQRIMQVIFPFSVLDGFSGCVLDSCACPGPQRVFARFNTDGGRNTARSRLFLLIVSRRLGFSSGRNHSVWKCTHHCVHQCQQRLWDQRGSGGTDRPLYKKPIGGGRTNRIETEQLFQHVMFHDAAGDQRGRHWDGLREQPNRNHRWPRPSKLGSGSY